MTTRAEQATAHIDPDRAAEDTAKRADALEEAKAAALADPPDLEPLRELARIEEAAFQEAEDMADRAKRMASAQTATEALDAIDPGPALATVTDWTGEPKPREWLAPAWLPAGRAALLTGTGGSGKSLLALQLAAGIAGGDRNPLHGDPRGGADQGPMLDGNPGLALFCTWEDEPDEILRRLAWAAVDREALADRLHVADLAGLGPLWAADPDDGPAETEAGKAVADLIRTVRPRLAVIDPTAGAYGDSENDRAAVRAWLAHLGALAAETGAAVLLIAHPPKERAGDRRDYSGSTDWRGGVRALWRLAPESVPGLTGAPNGQGKPKAPAKAHALTIAKANYARDGRRAWLRLQVVDGPGGPEEPPALLRWEEATAREAANAYHKWRGWDDPKRKNSNAKDGNGRTADGMTPEQQGAFQ